MEHVITIFAGNTSSLGKDSHYIHLAYGLGQALANAGFVVATGAGRGLMDEASRGAHEAGGKTIGLGLAIEDQVQSPYISHYESFNKLGPRQDKLIQIADAYIALPGGIGTIYEVMQILAMKRAYEMDPHKPLILMTDYFSKLDSMFETVIDEKFAAQDLKSLYVIAKTPEEATQLLTLALTKPYAEYVHR